MGNDLIWSDVSMSFSLSAMFLTGFQEKLIWDLKIG